MLVCRLEGVIEPQHRQWLVAKLDLHLAAGRKVFFFDSDGTVLEDGADSRGRWAWVVDWVARHREQLLGAHVLTRSANDHAQLSEGDAATSKIHAYDDEGRYWLALQIWGSRSTDDPVCPVVPRARSRAAGPMSGQRLGR